MNTEQPTHLLVLPDLSPENPSADYVKIEKNIASLGVFSALTARPPTTKTITVTRTVHEKRFRATVTITNAHGIPTTAHQDRTLAFMKLLEERRQNGIEIENPVGFHSAELLRLLGLRVQTGKNYEDIDQWLDVMTFTGIKSEQALYLAKRGGLVTDRFHIFERSVSYGKQMPDGTTADKNYVWFADWMLENIQSGYLLSIDFEAYKQLKNPIAKVLVLALHVWLYASERDGFFLKRYSEFCQYLGIREYEHLSKIKEKISPALNELVANRYLGSWEVVRGEEGFGVQLAPGPKYFEDRKSLTTRRRLGIAPVAPVQPKLDLAPPPDRSSATTPEDAEQAPGYDADLVKALMAEGVGEAAAIRVAVEKPDEARRQLAYLPYQTIKSNRGGFLNDAILKGYGPPPGYEAQKKQEARKAAQMARQRAQEAREAAEEEYRRYLSTQEKWLAEAHSEAYRRYEAHTQKMRAVFDADKPMGRIQLRSFDSETKQQERFLAFFRNYEPHPVLEWETWFAQQQAQEEK